MTFIIDIAFLASSNLDLGIYFFSRAQIAFLTADKASIFVSSEYADFANVFSKNLVTKCLKHSEINNYIINLTED